MAETKEEILEMGSSRFQWKVPLVNSVVQRKGDTIRSPPHTYCNAQWTLTLVRCSNSMDVSLKRRRSSSSSHDNYSACQIFKLGSDGTEHYIAKSLLQFFGEDERRRAFRDDTLLYKDRGDFGLKVVCSLHCLDCLSGIPAVFSNCSSDVGGDLLKLLVSGEHADLAITVKDRTFAVHKLIVGARAPVFFSTLDRDMDETSSGSVSIPECDPEAFQKFLEHTYSGEVKDLSKDTVCSLFDIADKFQVPALKEECRKFMSQNLTLETFFDITQLSARHDETELLERTRQFFVEHKSEIIRADRFMPFYIENLALINDFFFNSREV